MNGALVENAEDDVHGEERHSDQHGLGGERFGKRSCIALKTPLNGARRAEFAHRSLDDLGTSLDREARPHRECERHGWSLPLMSNSTHLNAVLDSDKVRQRDLLPT